MRLQAWQEDRPAILRCHGNQRLYLSPYGLDLAPVAMALTKDKRQKTKDKRQKTKDKRPHVIIALTASNFLHQQRHLPQRFGVLRAQTAGQVHCDGD